MNEAKATLLLIASPFAWVASAYVSGAKNLVRVIRREPAKVTKVRRITRPTRNYDQGAVAMARAILPRHYIDTVRGIGMSENDEFVLGWLRALPLALASQDFDALYDEMLRDERIGDDERDLIASAVLDAQAAEVALL